jgi:hypothetical protein
MLAGGVLLLAVPGLALNGVGSAESCFEKYLNCPV